jgi:aminodeoxyfutalosine synthase
MDAMIAAIADRVAQGGALTEADAEAILATDDLIAVGAMADDVRRRLHGRQTTFQRVFEVHAEAVPSALPRELAAGEIRIIGRPASPDAAIAAARAVAGIAGPVPVSGFSLADLAEMAGGVERLERLCADLRAAGLEAVAETSLDTLEDAAGAMAAARRGGLAVTRLTIRDLAPEDRVARLVEAASLQDSLGGLRALAPLPRVLSTEAPSTGYDDVKLVALARVMVTAIPSIQVDWALYGPKLAQVALTVGADDVDGVAAVETGTLGRRRTALEEIRGNIQAAALDPVERNARWEVVAG